MRMLEGLEIDGKDLRLIHNLYWNQEAAVRVGDKESETQHKESRETGMCDVP